MTKTLLIMKLTAILLFAICLEVRAGAYGQKTISLSVKNESLKKVFKEIKKQSGYVFFYDYKLLANAKPVTIELKDEKIEDALDQCLKGQPITYGIVGKTIVLKQKQAELQNTNLPMEELYSEVKGKVTDEKGQPLANVSITVKGTSRGTTSDVNGQFSIDAKPTDILEFSIIGYKTESIKIGSSVDISIKMQVELSGLGDVVVVGYGTQKKVNLTGAVASIKGNEIQDLPSTNLTNVLAGRLPGVVARNGNGTPGSGSTLLIRGNSTLGDNSPLVIVDGVQRDDFSSIDPNSVENITILKDAAASAVYGARANNGVFLITTKRGKTGKLNLSYTGSVAIQQPTFYPKLLSPFEYATTRNNALSNMGYSRTNPTQAGLFYSDSTLNAFKNGAGVNWYDATFKKNPLIANHNLTLSGGSDALKYFLSMQYINQDGMYDNINYKAYKFFTNVDAKISKNLNLGVELEGRQENNNAPGWSSNYIFFSVIRVSPTVPMTYWSDGKPFNTNGEHPIQEVKSSGYDNSLTNTMQATLDLKYQMPFIAKGLYASAKASFGKQYNFNKLFFLPYPMYNEDGNGNVTGIKTVGGQTYLSETFNHYYTNFYNVSLNYKNNFKKHDISGLLLYEQNNGYGDYLNAARADFPINSVDQLFVSGSNNQTMNGYSYIKDARKGVVGRVTEIYDNKYILEASFRYDGSYIFAPGNRFGFFPSISAGWRISEENFIKNNPKLAFIDNLKLRASRGLIGNDKVTAFQYQDAYTLATGSGPIFSNTPAPLIYYGTYPNANITWEKADNTDIGLEGSFWHGFFGFELDLFNKDTRDILWSRVRSIPTTFGRALPNENYARVNNKGFELTLTHKNQIRKVAYNLRGIMNFSVNKVTRIDDPVGALDFQKQLGKSIGYRYGYQSMGFFQSNAEAAAYMGGKEFGLTTMAGDIKYADVDGNGVIDSKDQIVLSKSTATPKIIFGLNGGINYHGFDFNFLLQGAAATNLLISGTGRNLFQNGGSSNGFEYLMNGWSTTNTNAKYPLVWIDSRSINDRNSPVWLKNNAYIRLKSVDVGYNFSRKFLEKSKLGNLRIYISATNLLTLSALKEFDPEAETGTGGYYPQQRVLSAGINVNF